MGILCISHMFLQVITNSEEESDVYLQLSSILDNTKKDLDDVIQNNKFLPKR